MYNILVLVLVLATSHITEVACVEISVKLPLQTNNYRLRERSVDYKSPPSSPHSGSRVGELDILIYVRGLLFARLLTFKYLRIIIMIILMIVETII